MYEYITYASVTMNVLMVTTIVHMNKQLNHLQNSLDLAMEIMESLDKRNANN